MHTKVLKNQANQIISGPLVIYPKVFNDERGYFYETLNQREFNKIVNCTVNFVQDNQSFSRKGTLRGLHYQLNPMGQGKLIRVSKGEVFDVIVDLRKKSKTFSSWAGVMLDSKNKNQLWIPKGFAHGFLTLSETALLDYKVTNFWSYELERTLLWNDRKISIDWPEISHNSSQIRLSSKDVKGLTLQNIIDKGETF